MIYCVCRGNTRGRGLCYRSAVTSTTCWFCSALHQHKAPTLQSPVCSWSGCSTTNVIWESRDSNATARMSAVHWNKVTPWYLTSSFVTHTVSYCRWKTRSYLRTSFWLVIFWCRPPYFVLSIRGGVRGLSNISSSEWKMWWKVF